MILEMNCTALHRKYLLIVLMIATGIQFSNGKDLSEYITREEPSPTSSAYETFKGLQVGNAQSTTLLGDMKLMMFIGHCFGRVSGGLYELFGLDEATMRLGLDYGFLPWLTAGFGRSTFEKTWDIRVALTKSLDLTMEYYAALVKPDPVIKDPLTLGIEIDTGGHLFQLVMAMPRE